MMRELVMHAIHTIYLFNIDQFNSLLELLDIFYYVDLSTDIAYEIDQKDSGEQHAKPAVNYPNSIYDFHIICIL